MDPRLSTRVGAVAFAELARQASFDPTARLDDATLRAHLGALGYAPHDAAVAFERTWGGLRFGDLTFGAGACAASGERGGPPGAAHELVPVVLSDNDNYYFVARDGAAWGQDGIDEPEASRQTSDGDHLVAQLILYAIAWDRRMHDLALDLDDARGAEVAAALGLPPIPEASCALTRAWGDDHALVLERYLGTLVAVDDPTLLARVPR